MRPSAAGSTCWLFIYVSKRRLLTGTLFYNNWLLPFRFVKVGHTNVATRAFRSVKAIIITFFHLMKMPAQHLNDLEVGVCDAPSVMNYRDGLGNLLINLLTNRLVGILFEKT